MKMEFDLKLTQEQKLIMTQQMQMSVKLLQMSNFELNTQIEKEVQENPILEAEYKQDSADKEMEELKKIIKHIDDDYGNGNYSRNTEEEVSPFNFISGKQTLKEFLFEQLNDLKLDELTHNICEYIVENIDNKGYLYVGVEDLSKELEIEYSDFIDCLNIVQNLDPAGIASRDLKECLNIQLLRRNIKDENIFLIVDNYLEYVAQNKFQSIAKELSITPKKAQEYGDVIKTLEPKPSRGFYTGDDTKFIVPEAYIRKIGEDYIVIMNNDFTPKLNINNMYKNLLFRDENKDAQKYVKDKLNSAMFLMKSINQRENTIGKILNKLVELQRDYFDFGDKYLKPMTLKDIADEISVHESTVSRAIRDKYVYTDKGTIKIKDLFTVGISNSSEDVSTTLIKKEIEDIIKNEDKKKPFSDQKISDMLKVKDMKISRRTVAKYREEIGIKSSSKRKRF